jgi:acetyl esterase/lipase
MLTKSILLLLCTVYIASAANRAIYTYKTVGDVKILLDVYTPTSSAPSGGYPVLFTIHGGGFTQGSKSISFTKEELTEASRRGWVIISIDYRLMPSVVLDEILEDVQDAYNWVRTELIKITPINTNLISVFGRSAGGGLAVLSAYKLSPRPKAVIAFYPGLTNWTDPEVYNPNTPVDQMLVSAANKLSVPVLTEYTKSGSSDPRVVLTYIAAAEGKIGWLAVTHDPNLPTDQVMAKLKEFSATENVDKNFPPTYLAHGTADKTVPYLQSVQLGDKLKEKNIPYVLDLIPGYGHDFDSKANLWEQHVLPAFDFVEKYMQVSKKNVEKMFLV